jgi:hypothetical protein
MFTRSNKTTPSSRSIKTTSINDLLPFLNQVILLELPHEGQLVASAASFSPSCLLSVYRNPTCWSTNIISL